MKAGSKRDLLPDGTVAPRRRELAASRSVSAKKDTKFSIMVDPVDEMFVQWVPEFEGKKLKSIAKGAADLGDGRRSEGQRARVFNS